MTHWLCCLLLLLAVAVSADDNFPCPCIPSHLCPRKFGESPVDAKLTTPITPCNEPDTVHCCGTSVRQDDQVQQAAMGHLEQEQQLMSAINNAIERMNQDKVHREDKSIGQSTENRLSTQDFSGQKDQRVTKSGLQEVLHKNGTTEKLLIVYAEKPNKNNLYFQQDSKPHIVLPTKELVQKVDSIKDKSSTEDDEEESESAIDPKVIPGDEKKPHRFVPHRFVPHTKKHPEVETRFKPKERKPSNLQQLFAKRRPSPLFSKSRTEVDQPVGNGQEEEPIDDFELAASNVEEIQDYDAVPPLEEEKDEEPDNADENVPKTDIVPSNQPEMDNTSNSTASRKLPFRSPPRRLVSQSPIKPVERQSGKSALDLLKRRSKGKVEQSSENMESIKVNPIDAMMIADIAKVMEKMNVNILNDMMKTNFTLPNEPVQPQRKGLPTRNFQSVITSRRNPNPSVQITNQGHQSAMSVGGLQKNQNTTPVVREPTKTNRFPPRPKFGPSTKYVSPQVPIVTPPTVEDSSKQTPTPVTNNSPRRPFTRIRTRPQAKTDPSTAAPITEPTPVTILAPQTVTPTRQINRRLPTRPRLRPEHMTINSQDVRASPMTELPNQSNQAEPNNFPSAVPQESAVENQSSEDLDGSGSDFDFQGFTAPQLETGFQPMIQKRQLNIVGPIPGGFHDPALGFNPADDIGLELPSSEEGLRLQFSNGRRINVNRNSANLLPPVFPVSQPPIDLQQQSDFPPFSSTIDDSDLLPPVQKPQPLEKTGPEQSNPSQRGNQPGELGTIQKEFNRLKNQYDTLLSRYADTLNVYIGQYKKLSTSSPPAIR